MRHSSKERFPRNIKKFLKNWNAQISSNECKITKVQQTIAIILITKVHQIDSWLEFRRTKFPPWSKLEKSQSILFKQSPKQIWRWRLPFGKELWQQWHNDQRIGTFSKSWSNGVQSWRKWEVREKEGGIEATRFIIFFQTRNLELASVRFSLTQFFYVR